MKRIAIAVVAVVGAGMLMSASPAGASLLPASSFAAGSSPTSVKAADLNNDGKLDLVTTNSVELSVLIGDGVGGFAAPVAFPVGYFARSLDLRDLNDDGYPDAVVGSGGSGLGHWVKVLLGDGAGGFGGFTEFPAGRDPWAVVTGDLDGDTFPDIAAANRVGDSISVLRGNGDGTFGFSTEYPVGDFPTAIAAGDLNGDGRTDLATANADSDNLSVLLANDSGGFVPAANYGAGYYSFGVALGNLDSNAGLDVAVADYIGKSVWTYGNNGSGSLSAPTIHASGASATALAAGDVNGDVHDDLLVTSEMNDKLIVLPGEGNGGFGPTESHPVGDSPQAVTVADLNGDGRLDAITANQADGRVSVLLSADPPSTGSPSITIAPQSLTFESQLVGSESSDKTVIVSNPKPFPVRVEKVAIAGLHADDFALRSDLCGSNDIEPGGNCRISVAFKPSESGASAAEVKIKLDGLADAKAIPLTGTGHASPAEPTKAKISSVKLLGPSKVRLRGPLALRVRVLNSGDAMATGVRVRLTGRKVLIRKGLAAIAPGQAKVFRIKFRPKKAGKLKLKATVTSTNAGGKTARRVVRVLSGKR